MNGGALIRRGAIALAAGAGVAVGVYGGVALTTWLRYGRVPKVAAADRDALLDRFIPVYEVVERHRIAIDAPAAIAMAAAREQDLLRLPIVRLLMRTRGFVMGATADERDEPRGLVAATLALGWGVLADEPGRELVMGAVTRPWEADVVFRALAPDEFADYAAPGLVKIAWTLRADPVSDGSCVFRTETRVVATDAESRTRFRRYWALASPGIALIRRLSLRPLQRDAERRARIGGAQV